jgi:peptide/nickel transport system permease protein
LILAALATPLLTRFAPNRTDFVANLKAPGWEDTNGVTRLVGTDQFGRDVFSRLLHGLRVSLVVAGLGTLGAASVGTALGLLASSSKGLVSTLIMRLVDLQLSVPFLLIAVMWVAFIGKSMADLVAVVTLFGWVPFTRVIRDRSLVLRSMEYVTAARALGASAARVTLRHLAPQLVPELLIVGTFMLGRAVILESSLGFLGLSIPPPTATLGGMVNDGRNYLLTAWWLTTAPGVVILLLVLGASLAGDALRDILDPKLKT